jgi:prepilin-type N-terminal cleavage/methylation domain-containing protein
VTPLYIHKTNRGFTLIEILVAMAVGLIVLGGVLSIFISQNRTSAAQEEVAYAQQSVRAALDIMMRDIMNAGVNPPADGSWQAIETATGTKIQVKADYSDPDGDGWPEGNGDTADTNEDVTYEVVSGQLKRNGTVMVDYVDSLAFGYVLADEDGTVLPPPSTPTAAQVSQIRAVIIRLNIRTENPAPDTGEYRIRTLENGVRIRNLGFQDIS